VNDPLNAGMVKFTDVYGMVTEHREGDVIHGTCNGCSRTCSGLTADTFLCARCVEKRAMAKSKSPSRSPHPAEKVVAKAVLSGIIAAVLWLVLYLMTSAVRFGIKLWREGGESGDPPISAVVGLVLWAVIIISALVILWMWLDWVMKTPVAKPKDNFDPEL